MLLTLAMSLMTACSSSEITEISFVESDYVVQVGNQMDIKTVVTPSGAENSKLDWSSSDESVATVHDGTVSGISAGSAKISAVAKNGVKASCKVTVKDIAITSISISDTSMDLKVGKTAMLSARITPEDATQKVKWISSDPAVVYVDNDGKVIAQKSGSAVIACTAGDESDSCLVTVYSDETAATENTTATTEATEATMREIDVESEVEQIKKWYIAARENVDKEVTTSDTEVYSKNGVVTEIVKLRGADGFNYRREYYYKNNKLYFAFYNKGKEEHRMYFSDGVFIRYDDETRVKTDYPNYIDCEFEERVITESSSLIAQYG